MVLYGDTLKIYRRRVNNECFFGNSQNIVLDSSNVRMTRWL